jgi:hypothetical protein
MVFINELLPNPAGKDAGNEWIEFKNDGALPADLRGWLLTNARGMKATLTGTVPPHGFLVIKQPQLKLTLRNSDEAITLYDSRGARMDSALFSGAAPEGKSLARNGSVFSFTDPTPGAENHFASIAAIPQVQYADGAAIDSSFGTAALIVGAIGIAVLLALAVLYCVRQSNGLSELFFGKH